MKPCPPLFAGQTTTLLTFGDEEFEGVDNLAGLGPSPTFAAPKMPFPGASGAGVCLALQAHPAGAGDGFTR